jgi:hypothetical protein
MRIIFIPGFGEDEKIFDNLVPLIQGEKLILNSWTLAGNKPSDDRNALQFARKLIDRFKITKSDLIIGHSMGGWIAWHIKHFIKCPIIHISSMTSTDRIKQPVVNAKFFYAAIKKGWVFTKPFKKLAIYIYYKNKPSEAIVSYIIDLLIHGNKDNVNNQLKVILKPVKEKITVQPDLRIHSTHDTILRRPKAPYVEVPGDHFCLYTHAADVAAPILSFIQSLPK